MKEKIKTICLVLITLSLMVYVGFYAWDIWEYQQREKENNQLTEVKYRECIYQCLCPSRVEGEMSYQPVACRVCESKCGEKYGIRTKVPRKYGLPDPPGLEL